MNTLSKDQTRLFFANADDYQALEARWSALVNSDAKKSLGPEHHLLYAALRGKDWRKGFAPITNPRKLANGGFYGWRLHKALSLILFSAGNSEMTPHLLLPFDGLISEAALSRLRALLPRQYGDAQGSAPTPAYNLPPQH